MLALKYFFLPYSNPWNQPKLKVCFFRDLIHNTSFSNKLVYTYTRLKRLASDKHSSLMDTFVHFKEKEVLNIKPQGYKILGVISMLLKQMGYFTPSA